MLVVQRSELPRYLIHRILLEARPYTSRPPIRALSSSSHRLELPREISPNPSTLALYHLFEEAIASSSTSPPIVRRKLGESVADKPIAPWNSFRSQPTGSPSSPLPPLAQHSSDSLGGEEEDVRRKDSSLDIPPQGTISDIGHDAPQIADAAEEQYPDWHLTNALRQSRYHEFSRRLRDVIQPLKSPNPVTPAHIEDVFSFLSLGPLSQTLTPNRLRSYAYGAVASAMLHRPDCDRPLRRLLRRQIRARCGFDSEFLYDAAQMTVARPDRGLCDLWDDRLRWLAQDSKEPERFVSAFLAETPGRSEEVQQLVAVLKKAQQARGHRWTWSGWIIQAEHYRRTRDLKCAVQSLPSMQMAIEARFGSGAHPFAESDLNALSRVYTSLMMCWVDTWLMSRRELEAREKGRPTKEFPPLLAKQFREILTGLGVEDVPVPFLCAWLNAELLLGKITINHQVWQYVRNQAANNYLAAQHVKLWKGLLKAARALGPSHASDLRRIVRDMLARLPPHKLTSDVLHGVIRCIVSPVDPTEPLVRASIYQPVSKTLDLTLLLSTLRMFESRPGSALMPNRTTIDETAWGIIKMWLNNPILDPLFVTPYQPLSAVQAIRHLVLARHKKRESESSLRGLRAGRTSSPRIYDEAWVMMSLALYWRRSSVQARASNTDGRRQRQICHLPVSKARPPTLQSLAIRFQVQAAETEDFIASKRIKIPSRAERVRLHGLRDYLDVPTLYGGSSAFHKGGLSRELRDVRESSGVDYVYREHEARFYSWMGPSLIQPLIVLVEDIFKVQALADLQWEKLGYTESHVKRWVDEALRTLRDQTGMDAWQASFDAWRASYDRFQAKKERRKHRKNNEEAQMEDDSVSATESDVNEADIGEQEEEIWKLETEHTDTADVLDSERIPTKPLRDS